MGVSNKANLSEELIVSLVLIWILMIGLTIELQRKQKENFIRVGQRPYQSIKESAWDYVRS
jgi:hypothetical protein